MFGSSWQTDGLQMAVLSASMPVDPRAIRHVNHEVIILAVIRVPIAMICIVGISLPPLESATLSLSGTDGKDWNF